MNFLKETILISVIALFYLTQGVGAIKCHYCDWKTIAQCGNETIECDLAFKPKCIVAKALDNGVEKFKKKCLASEDCKDIEDLCGRLPSTNTAKCVAGGCCNGSLCVPSLLMSISMSTSPSVKASSEVSSSKEMIPISSSVAMQSSKLQSSAIQSSAIMQSSKMQTTTAAGVPEVASSTLTTSSKEVIAKVTETSMKGMMGTPTTKNNVIVFESLITQTNTQRPTCKDSLGTRHLLSPLATVLVAVRLVALLL